MLDNLPLGPKASNLVGPNLTARADFRQGIVRTSEKIYDFSEMPNGKNG